MNLYIEYPKKTPQKPTRVNKFTNLANFQSTVSIHKYQLYLYAQSKKVKKNTFAKISKRIKYLRINLTYEVKDLYTENYKTLLKLKMAQINVHGSSNLILQRCQ
jgi:hypothetical protein